MIIIRTVLRTFTRSGQMAITIKEIHESKDEKEKKALQKYAHITTPDAIQKLEADIDILIKHNYKEERIWFGTPKIGRAVISCNDDNLNSSTKILQALYHLKTMDYFFERYKAVGWKVRVTVYRRTSVLRQIIFSRRLRGLKAQINASLYANTEKMLAKKRQYDRLKTELLRLEWEIQMLTESPNSRDPLLLPENADE